jgi:hypothetical protein
MNSVKIDLLSKIQREFTDLYSEKQRHPDNLMTCLERATKTVFDREKAAPDNTFMRDVVNITAYRGGRSGERPEWPVDDLDPDADSRAFDMWIDFSHAIEGDEPE